MKQTDWLIELPNSFIPMQFENPANADAHRETTAVEIMESFDGKLDALVLTAGTGGTVTGAGEELKKRIPNLKIYVVEPTGSPVLSGGKPGPHKIPGTGPGFIPTILNRDIYDEILLIEDEDAQVMARRLAAEEGIFIGASGAASAHFAIQVANTCHLLQEFFVWLQIQENVTYLLTYFQAKLQGDGSPVTKVES